MIPDVAERIDEHNGSSSDSDDGKSTLFDVKEKTKLFGRRRSVHSILGGGKYADVMLWRDKQLSGSIFAGVTVIWLLFEWIGYHLITFICHFLILSLAVLFVWSNVASFIGKSPPKLADVIITDDLFLCIADCLRIKINEAFLTFNSIASGKDLKNFLKVNLFTHFLMFHMNTLH
ncbi:hypothetical protein HPP92_014920 [Vanilla planifolia]|uniref:Reticulon-like protein n=1 Tax=Vanilla planifolia TaxID=51239 RepID=A0A835QME0_VANPL|nr:hypothetical protein HPP92_014920 [Vanilla planifolia]